MKQLEAISVVAPGFAGLNLQESPVTLEYSFALTADNCVIDKSGRIGARKGWTQQTTSGVTELSGGYIQFLHEHVNAGDTTTILSGGNNKLFSGGVGGALTDITPAAYTITANNWKAATLLDYCYVVQDAHEPVIFNAGTAVKYSAFTVNVPNFGSNTLKDVIAAYGRFWAHDGTTVYWTTDIADVDFPQFFDGSSGTLNINSVLPDNTDSIVALATHNNFLIIFCKRNIVIYQNADDVLGNFSLSDVITGVGCIARDSLQNTGADILFLSSSGVRSLGRVIQEKSLPMRDISKNVRDDVSAQARRELNLFASGDTIKSVYSEQNAFYLLSFPLEATVWCFDMRSALEDGSARVTKWYPCNIQALTRRNNGDIMFGKPNGIGKYDKYLDDGNNYLLRLYSPYFDMQSPTVLKIPKRIKTIAIGGALQTFVIGVNYDYTGSGFNFPFTIPGNTIAYYGTDEYGLCEYTSGISADVTNSPLLGSGNAVQISIETIINGSEFSLQKIDLFFKTGKTR